MSNSSKYSGTTGPPGPQGDPGIQGDPGATGPNGTNGQGVPTGGTTGQHLAKINATDYNTQWVTPTPPTFTEAFDLITTTTSGTWVTRTLAAGNANKIVQITIFNDSNGSRTVGVRAVGSSVVRSRSVNKDSAWSVLVQTNGSGQIQIFADNNLIVFRNLGRVN